VGAFQGYSLAVALERDLSHADLYAVLQIQLEALATVELHNELGISKLQAEFAGTGPTISVQWSGLAIVSVAVVAFSHQLLKQPLFTTVSAAVVTTSRLVTIVS
jgi:hypothetical protein